MNRSYVYAETAFHHEGDIDFMFKLIDAAVAAGVNGIKFQVLMNLDDLISKFHPAYNDLSKYCFTAEQWDQIFQKAVSDQLDIIVMPLDVGSFSLVEKYRNQIRYVELHSVSFNDEVVKESLKQTGIDVVVCVGGRTKDEINEIVAYFGSQLKVLMTGFQSFPSKLLDVRLRRISELAGMFPRLLIGYGDHSSFDDEDSVQSNSIAYVLGARVFEKHITLNEGTKRVDFESAVGIGKIRQILKNLDVLHDNLFSYGDSFEMTQAEVVYRNRQKMAVANRPLSAGVVLKREDIALKMVGRFDGVSIPGELIGKELIRDVEQGELIMQNYVSDKTDS